MIPVRNSIVGHSNSYFPNLFQDEGEEGRACILSSRVSGQLRVGADPEGSGAIPDDHPGAHGGQHPGNTGTRSQG